MKKTARSKNRNQRLRAKEIPYLWTNLLRCYLTKKVPKKTVGNSTRRTQRQLAQAFAAYLMYWNQKVFFHSPWTKKRTLCFLTGRSRSVYRAFHLSRLKIREFAAMGFFSGLSKASW